MLNTPYLISFFEELDEVIEEILSPKLDELQKEIDKKC